MDDYLIGVRLRATAQADDYRVGDLELHVGDLVLVEAAAARPLIGEMRRPRRALARVEERSRVSRGCCDWPPTQEGTRLSRTASARRARDRDLPAGRAQPRGLVMKVVDVEMHPVARRVTVYFNADERVDFRDLVRDLAREFRSRVEMRQIGARDTTRLMDGIGPVRAPALLHVAPARVRADLGEDGQGPGHAAHRQPAARQLRPAQVLPALRVLDVPGARGRGCRG